MALRINPLLGARARELRAEQTPFEQKLWERLRAGRLDGHRFRRQSVMLGRIADFYCPAAALVVEVDGDTHDPEADAMRDARFGAAGLRTIRVSNRDVAANLEGELEHILAVVRERVGLTHPPAPSLEREGEDGAPTRAP